MLLQLIRNGLDLIVYLEHKLNTRILHHLPYSDRQESREDANKRTLEQMTGCGYCDKRSSFLCDECNSATGKSTVKNILQIMTICSSLLIRKWWAKISICFLVRANVDRQRPPLPHYPPQQRRGSAALFPHWITTDQHSISMTAYFQCGIRPKEGTLRQVAHFKYCASLALPTDMGGNRDMVNSRWLVHYLPSTWHNWLRIKSYFSSIISISCLFIF